MHLVVEADDYDEAVRFYRDVLRAPHELQVRDDGARRVTILDAGRATLELATPAQSATMDEVEVGRRVSPRLHVAFDVADTEQVTPILVEAGAELVTPPVRTRWNSLNARMDAPAGLQTTLLEELSQARPRRTELRIELFSDDLDALVSFYRDVLSFEVARDERRHAYPYVALRRGAVRIGAAHRPTSVRLSERRPPTGVEIVIEVPDVVAERERVASLWPLEEDLQRRPWGLTDLRVLDPAGYYVRLTDHEAAGTQVRRSATQESACEE